MSSGSFIAGAPAVRGSGIPAGARSPHTGRHGVSGAQDAALSRGAAARKQLP